MKRHSVEMPLLISFIIFIYFFTNPLYQSSLWCKAWLRYLLITGTGLLYLWVVREGEPQTVGEGLSQGRIQVGFCRGCTPFWNDFLPLIRQFTRTTKYLNRYLYETTVIFQGAADLWNDDKLFEGLAVFNERHTKSIQSLNEIKRNSYTYKIK
jgi:hypothetical protein